MVKSWGIRFLLLASGLVLPFLLLGGLAYLLGTEPLSRDERLRVVNELQVSMEPEEARCALWPGNEGKEKIFVFGGSSAQGAFSSTNFPKLLNERLEKKFPGRYAVENFAKSARNSFFVLHCMDLVRDLGAKYWVVYEGHNDFVNLRNNTRTTLFLYENPLVTRVLLRAIQTRAAGLLRHFLPEPRMESDFLQLEENRRLILDASERNHREMIARARAAGAKLVLSTVISNLETGPWHAENVPPEKNAVQLFARAQELFAKGEKSEALRLFRLARDTDPRMTRAPSAYNEMVRRLANENPDVILLDLEREFEREFGGEKIGCRFFGNARYCDEMHPNEFTHEWIAGKLEAKIRLKQ